MNIPVVYSTDHNFIMPTGVSILSLLEHSNNCKPHIYILQSDNVTESDRAILRSICQQYSADIDFISMGDSFKNSFEIRDISTPAYYRLLIPWLLPEYEKIIYCDGDTIFNQSVSEIYDFAIENNYVAGVQTGFKKNTIVGAHIESLGLNIDDYINSGVLLINATKQREQNLKDKYLIHATKEYIFQDQDIINIVCKGHIGYMPREFNTTPNYINELVINQSQPNHHIPVIIHYAGDKPWKEITYWWLAWWQTYSRSPFYDPALEFIIEKNTLTKTPKLRPALSIYIRSKIPFIGKLIDRMR